MAREVQADHEFGTSREILSPHGRPPSRPSRRICRKRLDGRVKPGHEGRESGSTSTHHAPMNLSRRFSLARTLAIFLKELIQMRRDRLTLAMMVGIPIVQLVLFGFAINTDPKALPSYVKVEESSRFSRALLAGLVNSGY